MEQLPLGALLTAGAEERQACWSICLILKHWPRSDPFHSAPISLAMPEFTRAGKHHPRRVRGTGIGEELHSLPLTPLFLVSTPQCAWNQQSLLVGYSPWLAIVDTDGGLWTHLHALFWKQRQSNDICSSICFGRDKLEGDVCAWQSITCLNPELKVNILATAQGEAPWAVFPRLASRHRYSSSLRGIQSHMQTLRSAIAAH